MIFLISRYRLSIDRYWSIDIDFRNNIMSGIILGPCRFERGIYHSNVIGSTIKKSIYVSDQSISIIDRYWYRFSKTYCAGHHPWSMPVRTSPQPFSCDKPLRSHGMEKKSTILVYQYRLSIDIDWSISIFEKNIVPGIIRGPCRFEQAPNHLAAISR